MSLIGPRPLAVKYLPYYNEYEMHRHDVRPGLTGLAQVSGRNFVNWDERFAYDVKYVNKITFWNDLKIIFLTVKAVVKRTGIEACGSFTLQDFDEYRQNQIREIYEKELSIVCDQRYSTEDMKKISCLIKEYMKK